MSNRGSRFWGIVMAGGLVGMGLIFLTAVLDTGRSIDNPTPAITIVAGAAIFAALFFGPVGKAIARMLEGEGRADDDTALRLEDVEARLAELSLEHQRMLELEERLDFAERLLAVRPPESLPGGPS